MKRYSLLAMAAVYVSGCSAPSYKRTVEPSQQRGSIERVEDLRGYSRLSLAAMLWWAKLPEPI
jgi:PBP1b-binding outer membrane lipoprotein LpoB